MWFLLYVPHNATSLTVTVAVAASGSFTPAAELDVFTGAFPAPGLTAIGDFAFAALGSCGTAPAPASCSVTVPNITANTPYYIRVGSDPEGDTFEFDFLASAVVFGGCEQGRPSCTVCTVLNVHEQCVHVFLYCFTAHAGHAA